MSALQWMLDQMDKHIEKGKNLVNVPAAPDYGALIQAFGGGHCVLTDPEQLKDVAIVMADMIISEYSRDVPYNLRIHSKASDMAILYLINEQYSDWSPASEVEIYAVLNLYQIAPEWMQRKLDPLLTRWRGKIYKDPDYEQITSK